MHIKFTSPTEDISFKSSEDINNTDSFTEPKNVEISSTVTDKHTDFYKHHKKKLGHGYIPLLN